MTRFVAATYRCRQPSDTLATLSTLLTWTGAQVADASWLAPLGFPVAVAAAPRAPAPFCSIGAGATQADAMVSAAGGMLECWHARNAVPPASVTASAAEAKGFGYQIAGAGTREAELDWVEGWSIPSGRRALAPRDQVLAGPHGAQGTAASRRGLAVGNTRDEAIVHAVFEQAEAEAVRASRTGRCARQYFDPRSIPDAWSAEVISRVCLTGGHVEVARIPSPCGVPCFSAALRFAGDAAAYEGTAAHCDASLALSRALAEAVLSMVARAAIPALRAPGEPSRRTRPLASLSAVPSWDDVAAGWACQSDGEAAAEAARRVTEAAGSEPVVIDLAKSRDFAVVKVLFPLFQARPAPPALGR